VRLSLFSWLLFLAASAAFSAAPDAYAPLWSYNGTWHVARQNAPAGTKPEQLVNQCSVIGKYFACQQSVNGTPGELLVIIPTSQSGHYVTQSIMPDGRAGGLGGLEISGNRWVLTSSWNQGSKTTYYRTTNTFSGKTHIHFQQEESSNRRDWSNTASGDETHLASGAPRSAH
jgi:hypothetical protein